MEDLLAVIAEIRDMLVPPECRGRAEDFPERTSLFAPAASVDDFERNILEESIRELLADIEAMQAARREILSDMVLDAYYAAAEAASRDPENASLARDVKRMREILEKSLGSPLPSREETEALRQWERED